MENEIKTISELVHTQWDTFVALVKEIIVKLDDEKAIEIVDKILGSFEDDRELGWVDYRKIANRHDFENPIGFEEFMNEEKRKKNDIFGLDLENITDELNKLRTTYDEIKTTFLMIRERYVHPNRKNRHFNDKFSLSVTGIIGKYLCFQPHENDFTTYIYMSMFLTDEKYDVNNWLNCAIEVEW